MTWAGKFDNFETELEFTEKQEVTYMSDEKKSVSEQIDALNESFGQFTSRTNQNNCANQDADLTEGGITDDCKLNN